jgi:MoxR-like ATPase
MEQSMDRDVQSIAAQVQEASGFVYGLREEIGKVVVGQRYVVDRLLVGLLANGHILLEGVPGLAKTLSVKTLAQAINASFHRIQFTPDLLPADLIGTLIYNPREGVFTTKRGPIFANLILADEINRAPAKVQSALLEAMQERQVTIGDETFRLEEPFLVLATQNPIEQEGTYPLPEAQVDRFMLKLVIDYPTPEEERLILNRMAPQRGIPRVGDVLGADELLAARQVLDEIYMDDKIKDYIVALVHATRDPQAHGLAIADWIDYGASPRATIYLARGARAMAFLAGRGYVTPQDVKDIALEVLRHRVIVSYEAQAEEKCSDDVVRFVLDHVPVP